MDIALLEICKDGIEIRYAHDFKQHCYPILASLMIDYKEQVLIIGIKTNIQCSIYYILLKKREYITKL